ncbi:MAG: BadF/BadG/BcrA/BcrD ATPase family protein [Candidatus Eremiobacteraeota bacterium]|nr:BadF/BadG/BcrA/BcrD ATPase family protein [Candidatus Eremiobacteraeota bacterium]
MRVYIGIDGGGTKTRSVLVSSDGTLFVDTITQGSNLNHYGWERFQEIMKELFSSLRARMPQGASVAAIYCGLAGVDRPKAWLNVYELIQAQWPGTLVGLGHDAIPALMCASGKLEGVVLIGGTGAFAFGINEGGKQGRVGGWGYLLGDEGSGYDIGRRALQSVMRCYDYRGPDTLLVQKVLKKYDIPSLNEMVPIVYHKDFTRNTIASVAELVFEAAEEGDEISRQLLTQAADELYGLVDVLLKRLRFPEGQRITIVLTGGLFHEGSPLIGMIRGRLHDRAEVVKIAHPPVLGSVLLAHQLSGDAESPGFKEALNQIK